MSRVLPIVMLLVVLLVTGCADLARLLPAEDELAEPQAAYTAPTPESFPPAITTAARIRERGQLLVGIRYDLEPFSYIATDGAPAGLEVDLARELARRWLGDPDAARFRQVRSDTALQHLQQGDVDIVLAGIVHTQQAESGGDFSPPYFMDGLALLTFPDAGIGGVSDLGGHKVGVVNRNGILPDLETMGPVTTTYVAYDDFFQVVEALRTRQIDVYADQYHRLERARRMVAGTLIVGQLTFEPVALMYRENDPFFANLVACTFQDMAIDGTRDALYTRWLPDTSPPTIPNWAGTVPTPALADSPQERYAGNLITGIRERGVLEVGYFPDRWPYSADRDDGVQTGFEVRLLERMVERWLGSRQAITFVPVTEATAFQQLENGDLDMLVGGWVHTRDAEAHVDFSLTLFDDGVSILSLSTASLQTPAELAGQPVGVIAGSDGQAVAPTIGCNAIPYPDRDTAVTALQQGEVVALLAERLYLLEPLYRQEGFFLTDARCTSRPVAYVLPQGDSAFRDLVNLTLATLRADGTFADLYTAWFDDPLPAQAPWPGNPVIPLNLNALP